MRRGGPMKRTRMKRVGKRRKREETAEREFREAVLARAYVCDDSEGRPLYRCARCGRLRRGMDAHHLVARVHAAARWKHDPRNGAALCSGERGCHKLIERHMVEDWAEWKLTNRPW